MRNEQKVMRKTDARVGMRYSVSVRGTLRDVGGRPRDTDISDLSAVGCKASDWLTQPGRTVWIKVGHIGPLEGVVKRVDRVGCGIQFTQPLHPAVLDQIVALYRSAASQPA